MGLRGPGRGGAGGWCKFFNNIFGSVFLKVFIKPPPDEGIGRRFCGKPALSRKLINLLEVAVLCILGKI